MSSPAGRLQQALAVARRVDADAENAASGAWLALDAFSLEALRCAAFRDRAVCRALLLRTALEPDVSSFDESTSKLQRTLHTADELLKVLGELHAMRQSQPIDNAPRETSPVKSSTDAQHSRAMQLLNSQPAALAAADQGSGTAALRHARSLMAAEVDRLANVSAVMDGGSESLKATLALHSNFSMHASDAKQKVAKLRRANMKDRVVIGAGLLFFALCVAVVWAQRFKWIWNTLHWWVSWGGWFASLPLGLVWGGGFAQLPPLSTELTADLSPHPSSAAWPSIPPGTSEMDEL